MYSCRKVRLRRWVDRFRMAAGILQRSRRIPNGAASHGMVSGVRMTKDTDGMDTFLDLGCAREDMDVLARGDSHHLGISPCRLQADRGRVGPDEYSEFGPRLMKSRRERLWWQELDKPHAWEG